MSGPSGPCLCCWLGALTIIQPTLDPNLVRSCGCILPPSTSGLVLFLIAQALVLTGYVRYSLQTSQKSLGLERWVWALYVWGLVLLILASLIISWRPIAAGQSPVQTQPGLIESWPGLASLLLAAYYLSLLTRSKFKFPGWSVRVFKVIPNFEWAISLDLADAADSTLFFPMVEYTAGEPGGYPMGILAAGFADNPFQSVERGALTCDFRII